MTLTNRREFPPRGYEYFEAALNWRAPSELAQQGLKAVAQALSIVRAQNPAAGLDPSLEACVRAVSEFTCARLAQWPKVQRHYCGGGAQTEQERLAEANLRHAVENPRRCAGCGGGRR